jgi:hypothetical protein
MKQAMIRIRRPEALTLGLVLFVSLTPMVLFSSGELPREPLSRSAPLSKSAATAAYGKLPLSFEVNEGQTDRQVKFLSRGAGYGLFLTSTEAVLSLKAESGRPAQKNSLLPISRTQKPLLQKSAASKPAVLRVRLEGANSKGKVSGIDELTGKTNYFIGRDPAKWQRNIPTFA